MTRRHYEATSWATITEMMTVAGDGKPMIVAKRFYENLGLDWRSQYRKLQNTSWAVMVEMTTTGADGKKYRMTCIDVRTALMSLATIHEGKVSPEIRLTA